MGLRKRERALDVTHRRAVHDARRQDRVESWIEEMRVCCVGRTARKHNTAADLTVGGPTSLGEGVADGRGVTCLTTVVQPGMVRTATASPDRLKNSRRFTLMVSSTARQH